MEENISNIIANMSKDELLNIMRKEVEHGCQPCSIFRICGERNLYLTMIKGNFAYYMFQEQLASNRSFVELSKGIDVRRPAVISCHY